MTGLYNKICLLLTDSTPNQDRNNLNSVNRNKCSSHIYVIRYAYLCCTITSVKIAKTMCLAVPVRIVSIEGNEALTEISGVKRKVSIILTPEAKEGDYVLLHTGYAISVIDEAEANETLDLLNEIARHQ